MFARYRFRKKVSRILRDEFGFEEEWTNGPVLDSVYEEALTKSLNSYEAAVLFVLQVLRNGAASKASNDWIVPLESQIARARIGAITRLIDSRKARISGSRSSPYSRRRRSRRYSPVFSRYVTKLLIPARSTAATRRSL